MSRTQKENIFVQSVFSSSVWKVAVDVMDKYEQGKLKDQKLHEPKAAQSLSRI